MTYKRQGHCSMQNSRALIYKILHSAPIWRTSCHTHLQVHADVSQDPSSWHVSQIEWQAIQGSRTCCCPCAQRAGKLTELRNKVGLQAVCYNQLPYTACVMRSTGRTNSRPINGKHKCKSTSFQRRICTVICDGVLLLWNYVNLADVVQYGNGSYTAVHSYYLI